MININQKLNCCGCYGCVNICPKNCVSMEKDEEGFSYPIVDKVKCTNCGLCERVCPFINDILSKNIKVYACKNKKIDDRYASSSGGLFTSLYEYIINNNGVVFGAAFNEDFKVVHNYSETPKGCKKFRGSKYVQSEILDNYKKVKEYLDDNRLVLFSGTQCQVKALNLFLNKNYDNLITVDIVCHGVPSPLVMSKYIEDLKKKYNSDIEYINFRDKSTGWKKFSYSIGFKNKKIYSKKLNEDLYMKGFLQNLYLRPSCHNCKAKNFSSNSDISLADYWGINSIHKEFDDDKGVSLVLINSNKGIEVFSKISKGLDILETDLNHAIKYNPCIIKSVNQSIYREKFFKNIDNKDLKNTIEKYTK